MGSAAGANRHKRLNTVERQLYRLIPGEEEMSFTLQPVTSNEIDSDALYLDEITLTSEQDAVLRYG